VTLTLVIWPTFFSMYLILIKCGQTPWNQVTWLCTVMKLLNFFHINIFLHRKENTCTNHTHFTRIPGLNSSCLKINQCGCHCLHGDYEEPPAPIIFFQLNRPTWRNVSATLAHSLLVYPGAPDRQNPVCYLKTERS
jgi:hypothetical protein